MSAPPDVVSKLKHVGQYLELQAVVLRSSDMDVPLNVAHSVLSSDEPLAVTFRTSGVSALQASWPSLHVQVVEASP